MGCTPQTPLLNTRFRASLVCALLTLCAAVLIAAPASQAADPAPLTGAPQAGSTSAPSAEAIDQYLAAHGSPMLGQGGAFIAAGATYHLDPRLLVAISGAESSFGQITCGPFNAWGWSCPNSPAAFSTWADAINTVARGLRENYLNDGLTTVAAIQTRYAPVGATNDPTDLNSAWTGNVTRILVELGGDPLDLDMDGVPGAVPVAPGSLPAPATYGAATVGSTRKTKPVELAGSDATLTIALKNDGQQDWTAQTVRLRRIDAAEHVGSAPYATLQTATKPGERASFSVSLEPLGTTGATDTTVWQLETPQGLVGPRIERRVTVRRAAFAAGDAQIDAPAGLAAGAGGRVIIRVRNSGTTTWDRDGQTISLGIRAASGPALTTGGWPGAQVPALLLERTVEPGETGTFAFPISMDRRAKVGSTATLDLAVFATDGWASGQPARLSVETLRSNA